MDNGDKDDPTSPSRNNLFENAAASLLGMSPFGLPYAAHLAHLPGAFLMGHPGFPAVSLFGGLDGGLGHFPTSLATAQGTIGTVLTTPPISLDFSNGLPLSITIPAVSTSTQEKSSASAYSSLFSSASKGSPHQKSSPKTRVRSPSSSPRTTITKATTTIATTTTSSCSDSISKRTFTTPVVAGATGVSLLSGKVQKSTTKGENKSNGSTHLPMDTSTLSPPNKSSALNLSVKRQENGITESDCRSDVSTGSSNVGDEAAIINGRDSIRESMNADNEATDLSSKSASTIHIDGLKKKLIADQIRQRVQNKTQKNSPSIMQPMKKGRGRPAKLSIEEVAIDRIQEYKRQQEELKKQLEANLKEHEMQLKMYKKAQEKKEKETSTKINQLLEAHGKNESNKSETPGTSKPKSKSLLASIEKIKAASKSSPGSNSKMGSPTHKHETPLSPKLGSPTRRSDGLASPTSGSSRKNCEQGSKKKDFGSPTRRSNDFGSLSGQSDDESAMLSKLSSPTRKRNDMASSLRLPSPTERSKLFAETLFNKIRTEVERDNKNDEMYSKMGSGSGVLTDSGQSQTNDEEDSSDSDGSHGMEYDTDDRTCESDVSNRGLKRSADELSEDYEGSSTSNKRPRVQTDENILRIPLGRGWKRTTTILAIGKRGFIGEVLYFAPCGKKMKTIPDVMRYIDKHVITNLGRENFSFNTRVNVGEFYEQREENNTVKLTQEEIVERMSLIESKRQKLRRLKEQRGRKRSEKQNKNILLAKQMMEQKFKKKVEQQDMARKAAEYKLQKSLEKQRLKDMAQRIKHMKAMEKKKQQEQLRLLKEQEKLQRQEQMRMERELRAQQILETNLLWYHMEREREMKRQQAIMMKEQVNTDRERRRQHILLVKALEAQKKQAEKDRLKESKIVERRMSRERKMEQRRHELQLLRQLKRPVDDMQLKDSRAMPDYPRIKGIELDGSAYADILMVLEFLHNFAEALGFDNDTLPTMKTLQEAVIGKNEEDMEDYIALTSHLTRYAVMDPGVPNPKEAITKLGQKITDVDINDTVVSEILRIFITARNGKPNEMSEWLNEKSLEALDQNQRASILAFLCNELLCGKSISSEIEKNLDHMGDIRRDKWVIEGKLRRLRVLQAKKYRRPTPVKGEELGTKDGDDSMMTADDSTMMSTSKRGSDEEDEKDDESGNEYDENQSVKEGDADEDENLSLEDVEKKIEKLQKQHAQQRAKVFKASHRVRAITLGQDRYKRRYWVLPKAGGVYVEGLESGDFDEVNIPSVVKSEKDNVKQEPEKDSSKEIKHEKEADSLEKIIKSELGENNSVKSEKCDTPGNTKTETNSEESKPDSNGETKPVVSSPSAINQQSESNIFLQSPSSTKLGDLCELNTIKSEPSDVTTSSSTTHPPPLITPHSSPLITPYSSAPSPFHTMFNSLSNQKTESIVTFSSPMPAHQQKSSPSTDSKSSFLSIDTLLKKENDMVKPSTPAFNAFPMAPDQMAKSLEDDQKPWFSILPRLPCSDLSVAQINSQHGLASPFSTLPFFSPFPVGAFPSQNHTFSSFQMGQLSKDVNGANDSLLDGSFKVPDTPKADASGWFEQMEMNTYDEPQPIPQELTQGWWRIIEQDQLRDLMRCCHPRGIREKNLQKILQKFQEYAFESCTKGDKNVVSFEASDSSESEENEPAETEKKGEDEEEGEQKKKKRGRKKKKKEEEESKEPTIIDHAHQVELSVLDLVENLEERVASASLQVKGWKVPQRISDESDIKLVKRSSSPLKENERYPLDVAREKLVRLEPNIERRYLKPPLCKNQQIKISNITASSLNESRDSSHLEDTGDESEDMPANVPVSSGLLTWRNAVATAASPAQLTMCVYLLNNAISWEKSIMKVLCQICRKDDNEAKLLLCDGCDKGYHTYCFKPKMDNIPEGDWYCYACISKATGEPCCVVCGKKNGKIVECDHCPRAVHIDCLDPPLPRMPRKYSCPSCLANQGMKKKTKRSPKKRRESFVARERKDSETSSKAVEVPPVEKKRGKNAEKLKTAEQSDDMTVCRLVLTDLEKHDDGWPFLKPVNFKQFPTYKKYIKNPMDFTTMKNKLRDEGYKTRADFASDARLVFNNCMIFNEDESDVGKAGHTMRKFFESRWKEVLMSSTSPTKDDDDS